MRKKLLIWVWMFAGLACSPLFAGDAESAALAVKASEFAGNGAWRDAAKAYEEAEFEAVDPQLRLNSLLGAAEAWRKAGMLYKEYEAIEKMLSQFPGRCDFAALTAREYAIAQAFADGHRDPAFWQLRAIPWLTDKDRTAEIGEQALKHAPFAAGAAQMRLKLALLYDKEGKVDDAIRHLRALVKDYPDSAQYKYGLLGLGEMLYFRSRRGDGDGQLNREAVAVFEEFRKKFPDATELPYVESCILRGKDIQAERMLGIARYYNRTGRKQAAQQYLNMVLKEFPDSKSAADSESLLVKIDKEYVPEDFLPEVKSRELTSPRRALPAEEQPLLIAPENSGGKYLLPVYDVMGAQKKDTDK